MSSGLRGVEQIGGWDGGALCAQLVKEGGPLRRL